MLGRYSLNDRNSGKFSRGEPKDLLAFFEPEAPTPSLPPTTPSTPAALAGSPPSNALPPQALPDKPITSKRDILVPASAAPKLTPYEDLQPTINASIEPQSLPPDDPFLNLETDNTQSPDTTNTLPQSDANPTPQIVTAERGDPNFVNQLALEKHTEIVSHGSMIWDITFINKDKWLCVGKMNNTLTTYDLSTGKELWKSERLKELMMLDFVESSPTGDAVFAKDRRGCSIAMKVNQDGSLEQTRSLSGISFSSPVICASPVHPFVATGAFDGKIVWQPYSGGNDTQRSLHAFKQAVQGIYLPTKGTQAMATDGNELVKFSLKDGSITGKWQFKMPASQGARFNRAGDRVLMNRNGSLTEHDVKQGKLIRTFQLQNDSIEAYDYHASQPWVTASNSRNIIIWDAETTQKLATFDLEEEQRSVTFSKASDTTLLVCCPKRRKENIQIYRVVSAKDSSSQ